MDVAIVFKWSRDPQDAAVRADGSVDWRGAKNTPSDDDAAAIAEATALAAATGGQVVGITLGDGDPSWALARGAARVVSVADAPSLLDDASTAAALAAAVRRAAPVDVVVMGDMAENPGVAGTLAALLGVPALLHVDSVGIAGEGTRRLEARRTNGSCVETLAVDAPALVAVAAASAEKRTPGMKELLAARKRPVEKVPAADIAAPASDRFEEVASLPPAGHTARIFQGDPAQAAADLVAALRADGVL
jgi:electron transfer flavoprotein beta subunit